MAKPRKFTNRHFNVLNQIQDVLEEQNSHEALRDTVFSKFDRILDELAPCPDALAKFFAAAEIAATEKAAESIARHFMRADEVTALVEARKAEIEAAKEARKAARDAAAKNKKNGGAE